MRVTCPAYAGRSPPKYLSIIAHGTVQQIAKIIGEIKLIRSTKPSGVKVPSEPKGTSRSKIITQRIQAIAVDQM